MLSETYCSHRSFPKPSERLRVQASGPSTVPSPFSIEAANMLSSRSSSVVQSGEIYVFFIIISFLLFHNELLSITDVNATLEQSGHAATAEVVNGSGAFASRIHTFDTGGFGTKVEMAGLGG